MQVTGKPVDSAERALRTSVAGAGQMARQSAPWVERAARLGYAAKGVVYVTLALIAIQAALGSRQTEGQRGALDSIADQPAGKLLLVLIVVGMFGYAAWRLIESAQGGDGEGDGAKGIAKRLAHAASGLLYASLGVQALRVLRGASAGGAGADDSRSEDWTARLMALPWGRALVIAAGLGVIGYALQQLYKAVTSDVLRHLDLHDASAQRRRWITHVGRAGVAARAVVFLVIGGFLVQAALHADPTRATGLAGALDTLQRTPAGPWLLVGVAIGLLAFGLFQGVQARYRQVNVG